MKVRKQIRKPTVIVGVAVVMLAFVDVTNGVSTLERWLMLGARLLLTVALIWLVVLGGPTDEPDRDVEVDVAGRPRRDGPPRSPGGTGISR